MAPFLRYSARYSFESLRAYLNEYLKLPDRLMVGPQPLELCILVRIQVWQQSRATLETRQCNSFRGLHSYRE